MTQRHRGRDLVYILAAWAGRSGKRLLEIDIANPKLSHSILQIHRLDNTAGEIAAKAHSRTLTLRSLR